MLAKLKEIIVDMLTVDPDEITDHANLRDDLDMSSLDLINLAVELEKAFNIGITNKTIVAARTVDDVLDIIKGETNKKAVGSAV